MRDDQTTKKVSQHEVADLLISKATRWRRAVSLDVGTLLRLDLGQVAVEDEYAQQLLDITETADGLLLVIPPETVVILIVTFIDLDLGVVVVILEHSSHLHEGLMRGRLLVLVHRSVGHLCSFSSLASLFLARLDPFTEPTLCIELASRKGSPAASRLGARGAPGASSLLYPIDDTCHFTLDEEFDLEVRSENFLIIPEAHMQRPAVLSLPIVFIIFVGLILSVEQAMEWAFPPLPCFSWHLT